MVWTDELKNREPTTMTVRLQKEVDKYKVGTIDQVFMEHTVYVLQ